MPGRIVWAIVVVVHALAAIGWWWMMPAGFPLDHARFWLHRVVPFVLVAFAVAHFAKKGPERLAAIPATYLAAAIAGRILFPTTLARLWLAPFVIGLALAALWLVQHRSRRGLAWAVPGALLGVFLARAQQGPPPSTHPVNVPFVEGTSSGLAFAAPPLSIGIDPLLRFVSRSPDACWTVLASDADRTGPVVERGAASSHVDDRGVLHIDARTEVPRTVYTHLNTYAYLSIVGQRRLFLAFSPAPDRRIEVRPSDYPTGRPARFAYVTADRTLHVVEAADAEKGPFTALATGPIADPLSIVLYDEDRPIARITFEDFAAQASTALSPTAGWGIPQNAISFSLANDGSAHIFLTLAGTGVGRGFESVAHAPGTYRNRMRVERL